NSERVFGAAMAAYDALYESNTSAAASIRAASKQIEELSRFDAQFREKLAELDSARITVEDIGQTLRDYAAGIEASPERLAEVEDRLAVLDRLKRKYGPKLEDVIAMGDDLERKLNEMENKDEVLRELHIELANAAAKYLDAARSLSRRRYEAAHKLEKLVESEINELAMKARFKVEVSGSDEEGNWSARGFDQVQYLISANPGEPLGPVEEIASGGELSRVMLALKTTVETGRSSRKGRNGGSGDSVQRTLVFDEIDSGIGGRAAEAVGKKLKQLSRTKQVLCVTHLPPIASFADQHYLIAKHESGGTMKTSVRPLDADMLDAFERIIPKLNYRHPHDPAHVPDHILSALIGTSLSLLADKGWLLLGTWQRVILVELDGPRQREIAVGFVPASPNPAIFRR